jgi:hypothetical protein
MNQDNKNGLYNNTDVASDLELNFRISYKYALKTF